MPSIIQLPPQDSPTKVTANAKASNLHGHFLAFLNVNNSTGFTHNEICSIDKNSIAELLLFVSVQDFATERSFKRQAKNLKIRSGGLIPLSRAYEILPLCLATKTGMKQKDLLPYPSRKRLCISIDEIATPLT